MMTNTNKKADAVVATAKAKQATAKSSTKKSVNKTANKQTKKQPRYVQIVALYLQNKTFLQIANATGAKLQYVQHVVRTVAKTDDPAVVAANSKFHKRVAAKYNKAKAAAKKQSANV